MTQQIDPCATMRNNLIAAALGLQRCTKIAANIVPLPGTDRFIAIGTPAEVARLLEIAPAGGPIIGQGGPAELGRALASWIAPNIEAARRAAGCTPRVDALMAKWEDDGAARGSAFIELRDLARELEWAARPAPAAQAVEARRLLERAHRVLSCAAIVQIGDGEKTWEGIGKYLAAPVAAAAQADDAKDAVRYRKLRDAGKVPAGVWHALEQGDGLDWAMDCWIADTSPVPFCEPCKAGRYSECLYVIPCTPPMPATAERDQSEGGHHD